MVIAYLILCHNDPDFNYRVAKKLTDGNDNVVYVHVDLKSDIEAFSELETLKNVHLIKERVNNYWGGFNSVIATMNLFTSSLNSNAQRFVLLQGTDYPIKSNQYINEFFEKNRNIEFCKGLNLSTSKNKKNYMKVYGYHSFDLNRNEINFKTLSARLFSIFNKLGIKYRNGYFTKKGDEKKSYYWGWAQVALTRECVEYVVSVFNNNEKFNKSIRHKFPPDEIYIPSIIYNSKFRKRTSNKTDILEKKASNENMLNLTYFEYPIEVKLYKKIDDINIEELKDFLFIRKVNSKSNQLLEFIDQKYLNDKIEK